MTEHQSSLAMPRAASKPAPTTDPFRSFDVLLAAGFALLAYQLAGPILTIPLRIPINYNEGWNATFAARAVLTAAGPLYPGPESWVFNNYPPLGFLLVGALGRYVLHDMIVAGRITALAALLGAGVLTGLCVQRLGGRTRAACAAGLLLPLYVCFFYRLYVAVDDPQWLAQALMLCGLAVLLGQVKQLSAGGRPVARIVAAALLVVAGGFVKHNLVALPLAVTVWLLLINRRAAVVWITVALAAVSLGVAAVLLAYGHAAFTDILHHRRIFRLALLKYSGEALGPMLPMAVVATVLLRLIWRRRWDERRASVLFAALFGALALLTGILQRAGEGVYYNAHFETLVAACLGFGLAISPLFGPAATRWKLSDGPVALTCFAALPLICACPWHLPRAWHDMADRSERTAAWQPMIARIHAVHGPAGCLTMSLCWWAGKPSEIDMFNLTEISEVQRAAPASFRDAVARRHFAILEDDPASFTHLNAKDRLAYDPVMSLFANVYAVSLHGPEQTVLLTPIPAPPARRDSGSP